MFLCVGFYFCIRRQNVEERIPLLRIFNNRPRPPSPVPLHNMSPRPGSDPTPQSIDSSPRNEFDSQDGAGRDEAETSFKQATSIEVEKKRGNFIQYNIFFSYLEPALQANLSTMFYAPNCPSESSALVRSFDSIHVKVSAIEERHQH